MQAATATVLDNFGNDVAFKAARSMKGKQALRSHEYTARPLTIALVSKLPTRAIVCMVCACYIYTGTQPSGRDQPDSVARVGRPDRYHQAQVARPLAASCEGLALAWWAASDWVGVRVGGV